MSKSMSINAGSIVSNAKTLINADPCSTQMMLCCMREAAANKYVSTVISTKTSFNYTKTMNVK